MFNLTTKFILAASVLILGGVSAASAQLTNGEALKVSVPSAFVVSDKTLSKASLTDILSAPADGRRKPV